MLDDLTGLARLFAVDTSLNHLSVDKHQIKIILNEDLQKLIRGKNGLLF